MNKYFDKHYPVTNTLVVLNTMVFLAMLILRFGSSTSSSAVYDFGGMWGMAVRAMPSEIWRFITAIFVHIGFEHYAMNTLTLYFLGREIEAIYGAKKFLLLYLLSGIMGNIFVFLFTPNTLAAGASTALFGMFAAIATLRYFVRNTYIQQLGQSYMMLLALNLFFGLFNSGISMAGHLGGALGGALCAFLVPIAGERYAFTLKQRLLALATYLIFLALVIFEILRFN